MWEYVCLVDRAGTITWADRFEHGYRPEDVLGKPLWSFARALEEGKRIEECFGRALRGQTVTSTLTTHCPNGNEHNFEVELSPIHGHGAAVVICKGRKVHPDVMLLTDREREVLRLTVQDVDKRIARILDVSERTVRASRITAAAKLGLTNGRPVIAWAAKHLTGWPIWGAIAMTATALIPGWGELFYEARSSPKEPASKIMVADGEPVRQKRYAAHDISEELLGALLEADADGELVRRRRHYLRFVAQPGNQDDAREWTADGLGVRSAIDLAGDSFSRHGGQSPSGVGVARQDGCADCQRARVGFPEVGVGMKIRFQFSLADLLICMLALPPLLVLTNAAIHQFNHDLESYRKLERLIGEEKPLAEPVKVDWRPYSGVYIVEGEIN